MSMMALLGADAAWGATKNGDTGRYAFQDYETQKPGLFVLDVKTRRYVDSGYAAYWAGLKAQEPIVAKAAADALAKTHLYRTIMLYSVLGTVPGYMIEAGNARSVAWVAADNWALAYGKPAPYGCPAYAEFLSVFWSAANFPEGPAFTLLSGPFYGFNRKLDILTGWGLNRSFLVNAAVCAAKGTIFGLTATTGYHGFFRMAEIYFHNALIWSAMTTIPANMLVNAGYGFLGKGVSYADLYKYQTGNMPVGATGVDFGRQYKAMSKFGQLVF